jgi:hypothetical protein
MELSEEQKLLLKQDEENGKAFETFLDEINKEYKSYFDSRHDDKPTITHYFLLLRSGRPPAIRLRYAQPSNLDEGIKQKVITKYKELFGKYADYQIIER